MYPTFVGVFWGLFIIWLVAIISEVRRVLRTGTDGD